MFPGKVNGWENFISERHVVARSRIAGGRLLTQYTEAELRGATFKLVYCSRIAGGDFKLVYRSRIAGGDF